MFLLGLGQGASLGLGIFYTMARAPDPVTSASLSAFAQSIGYLLASPGRCCWASCTPPPAGGTSRSGCCWA